MEGWLNSAIVYRPERGEVSDDTRSDGSSSPTNAMNIQRASNNTDLLSKLSSMEATHINQLHEVTSQMAERELQYKEEVQNKDMQLQQSQNRVSAVERRIRERDAQMTSLKEEKAGCLRQIDDLKNQLYQLQFEVEETTCDKADAAHQFQSKLDDAQRDLIETKRALDGALQSQVGAVTKATALEQENNSLKIQMQSINNGNQTEIAKLQQQLSNLQQTNATLTTQIAEEKASTTKNKQLNSKEISNLRSMLRSRDEAIQSLQGRVEKGQDDMTKLEAELDDIRREKQNFEGWQSKEKESRQDEVDSLVRKNEEMSRTMEAQTKDLNSLRAENEEMHTLVEKERHEVDSLLRENEDMSRMMDEQTKELDTLRAEHEEMQTLVEKQSHALEEMAANWDRQKEKYEEQCSLAEQRGEEIERLKSAVKDGEREKEESLERSNSSHSRVTELEMELQKMHEKVDDLSSHLHESMEETEDLQADVVFKEGRIASLEKEIEEASSLLEARAAEDNSQLSPPPSPGWKESSKFARLRQEIENVTRERVQLEKDHDLQMSLLKTSKDCEIAKLEKELSEVNAKLKAETEKVDTMKQSLVEIESSKNNLSHELEKTRNVMDQLDAEEDHELEELKQKVEKLQLANDKLQYEIEDLRMRLKEKERELAKKETAVEDELREAQQALIALDKERRSPSREQQVSMQEMKALREELSDSKEQIRESEAKLNQIAREKEIAISDLKNELASKEAYAEELRDEMESLQLSVERGPSKRSYGMSIDPEWHEPDTISKLKVQVSTLTKEKKRIENELRAKIEARDSTIAKLVVSSSNQEATIADLKSEVKRLQALVDNKSSSESMASEHLKDIEASRRREIDMLRERTHDLSIELKQTKRKLLSVTEELDCTKSQLETADAMPDVQDLAGRLVISEQAQKMLKTENLDKLQERDTAIANLLQSVQANEGVIANLRADVESFKRKLSKSVEENRRLQHESEIFAAQIIDQDEEFESLNARLKDKTNEIASLRREIASSSAEVRNVKYLERQLDELKEEKRHSKTIINNLEDKLRDIELKKVEEEGYEVERLKLELKNAIADKEMMEKRLTDQIDSLRKLRNHAVEDFETKLQERAGQITALEKELLELREKVMDDDFDDIFLDDKQGQSKKELAEERDLLLLKVEALEKEIKSLKSMSESRQLSQLSELKLKLAQSEQLREEMESNGLSELKLKLAKSEQLREEMENNRSMFNSSKDKELDRLHMQLSEARQAQSAREEEQLNHLKQLETENSEIREEFRIRMKEKNAKIVALEQTLAAQEQVVGNMSNEMDQLQNGMEKVSVQRRAEIEEMSQELMDYTSKATRLEREVIALSMKLDDKKLKHKAEVAKLKDRIATLESESPLERIARHDVRRDDNKREIELAEKNDHLKWLNSSLKDEIEKLKGKVEMLKASSKKDEKNHSPKSAKNNDKWRNVALQEQVAVLSQRVIELEEAASSATNRRPPQSPSPSILQSPVMRSSLEASSSSGTVRSNSAPKSVLRTPTYDDTNQANQDLLSNDNNHGLVNNSRTPPSLPRGSSTPKSVKSSRSASSRFSFRKKGSKDHVSSSPKFDDASNSTANYDF